MTRGDGALGPPVRSESVYAGTIVNLRVSEYRRPDGTVVRREVMDHPGAVVMVPVEDDHVLMVRQPREAIERYTLELPAGKLDHAGEDPLGCARRELAEEVGRAAATWRDLGGFFTAPAIITEFIHCFMATDLTPVDGRGRRRGRGHRGDRLAPGRSRRPDRAHRRRQDADRPPAPGPRARSGMRAVRARG